MLLPQASSLVATKAEPEHNVHPGIWFGSACLLKAPRRADARQARDADYRLKQFSDATPERVGVGFVYFIAREDTPRFESATIRVRVVDTDAGESVDVAMPFGQETQGIIAYNPTRDTPPTESSLAPMAVAHGTQQAQAPTESGSSLPPMRSGPVVANVTPMPSGYHGAIAISTKTVFRSGACVDQPSAQLAESCALRDCGSFCEIRVVFGSGQCAAIAGTRRRSRPEDVVVGSSSTAAREAAMSQCRSHPRSVSFSSARCEHMAPTICNLAPEMQDTPAVGVRTAAIEPPNAGVNAMTATGSQYGAIAVSTTSTFKSGACVNEPSPVAAESCALRECGRHCEVHVAFAAGQCAMVAGRRGGQGVRSDDPRNRWRLGDAGVGNSPAAARESAMAECQRDNRNCRELVSPICNG